MAALGDVASGHSTVHARLIGDYIGTLEALLALPCIRPDKCDSACSCCQRRFHRNAELLEQSSGRDGNAR